jgi:prephenate dehydrogenase
MWRDITLANRAQLRVALDGFVRELQGVQALLRSGNSAKIQKFLETAKARRDRWRAGCVSPSPE